MDDLEMMKKKLRKLAKKGARRRAAEQTPDTSLKRVLRAKNRKNSRTKGASFENKIAKVFSEWSGMDVKRTPQSGGWANASFGVTGDLVCSNKRFPFHVECKKREGWHLDDLVTGVRVRDTRSIVAWWNQAIETCPEGKEPLLVFARNNRQVLVMVREDFVVGRLGTPMRYEAVPKLTLQCVEQGHRLVTVMTLERFLAATPKPKKRKRK